MPSPFLKITDFTEIHAELDHKLRTHMISGRGKHLFDDALKERLQDRSAHQLPAVNARARIKFATGMLASFLTAVDEKHQKFRFVTFSPRDFAVPLSQAADFDHELVRDWAMHRLAGYHFVGMVEAAFYTNANAIPGVVEPMVSWHAHAVVWGDRLHVLDARCEALNLKFAALLPGKTAARSDVRTRKTAKERMIYMSKGPVQDYRVFAKKREVVDPETGEIKAVASREFGQKEWMLKPGNAVKIFKVMGDRTIPDLAFSGGDGDAVLARAIEHAKQRIRRQDEEHRRHLEGLLRTPRATQTGPRG